MRIRVARLIAPLVVCALLLTAMPVSVFALQNPLLPLDNFTPDVEARVYTNSEGETRLYLYGSNDEYPPTGWCSYKYHVYSAPVDDLDNWTDHGVSFASRSGEGYMWDGQDSDGISWSDSRLFAPDAIEFEGKYWLVSCLNGGGLGMSVSDTPEGPFSPAKQIVYDDRSSTPLGSIDPALYEEDGVLYLLWGQMKGFGGGAEGLVGVTLDKDADGIYSIASLASKKFLFGTEANPDQGFGFYEGPSIRKINGRYYILYPSNKGAGQHMMSYAVAEDGPLGTYVFGGNVLDSEGIDRSQGNNHGSFCEVNGQWYLFYHRGFNGNTSRKVCVEPLTIHPDGSIDEVPMTNHGFGGPPSPFEPVEAATLTHIWLPGTSFARTAHLDQLAPDLHPLVNVTDNSCIEYRDFDFGEGGTPLVFRMEALPKYGGTVELVLDDPNGEPVGSVEIPVRASDEWMELTANTRDISGVHTLYLRFGSSHKKEIVQLARFRFEQPGELFTDSFDGGLGKWKNLRNARIEDEKLIVSGNQVMVERGAIRWNDYALQAEVSILEGQAGVAFRKTEDGTYYGVVLTETGVELVKSIGGAATTLAQAPGTYATQTPYGLAVDCVGGEITVRIDGVRVIAATDNSLTGGTVGFLQPAGTTGRFDNIVVMPISRMRSETVKVNGVAIPNFSFDQHTYSLKVRDGDPVPVVTASASGPNVQVSVRQATGVPGEAVVVFTENGADQVYTISFVTSSLTGESDWFDQPEPIDNWTVLNPDPGGVDYRQGTGLRITSTGGDLPHVDNMYLQRVEGNWEVETKITVNTSSNYSQAGLTLYEDASGYTKFVIMNGNTIELQTNGNATKPQAGVSPAGGEIWLRIKKAGSRYTFSYSVDGSDFAALDTRTIDMDAVNVGLIAFAPLGGSIDANFHYFKFQSNALQSDWFDGAEVGDFWDVRNSNAAKVSYTPGTGLTITGESGDIGSGAKNMFLQQADGDWEVEIKATVSQRAGYASFGLVVYESEDSFIKFIHMPAQNSYEVNTSEGDKSTGDLTVAAGDPLWMAIKKAGNTYTFRYSTNGVDYTEVGDRTKTMQAVNVGFAAVSFNTSGRMEATFEYFKATLDEWFLDPLVEVTGIDLAPDRLTMSLGEVQSTLVSVTPDNATLPDITWTVPSGDDVIALLSGGGSSMAVFEAVQVGTATLRAESALDPTVFAECEITVEPDKRQLAGLVAECGSYAPGGADAQLLERFGQALDRAREALADATTQGDVDDAFTELQLAYYAVLGVDDSVEIIVDEAVVANEGYTNNDRLSVTLDMDQPELIDSVVLMRDGKIVDRWDYDDLVTETRASGNRTASASVDGDLPAEMPTEGDEDGAPADDSLAADASADGVDGEGDLPTDDDSGDKEDDDGDEEAGDTFAYLSPSRYATGSYAFTIDLSGRPDGNYRIVVKMEDGGGTYSFILDQTPPVLTHDGRGTVTIVEDNMASLWDNGVETPGFTGTRYTVDLRVDHEIVAYDKAGNSARLQVERQGTGPVSAPRRRSGSGSSSIAMPASAAVPFSVSATASATPDRPVTAARFERLLNSAVAQAGAGNAVQVRLSNYSSMDEETAKRIHQLCGATGREVTIHFDTVADGAVVRRLSVPHSQLAQGLSIGFNASEEERIARRFARQFDNALFSVCLNEAGPVRGSVAAKVPDGLDTGSLVIYQYDPDKKKYAGTQLEYTVDYGYLHFDIQQGGVYLISDGVLARTAKQ